jgi:hypothetical protein
MSFLVEPKPCSIIKRPTTKIYFNSSSCWVQTLLLLVIGIHILELTLRCYRWPEGLMEASTSLRWQTARKKCVVVWTNYRQFPTTNQLAPEVTTNAEQGQWVGWNLKAIFISFLHYTSPFTLPRNCPFKLMFFSQVFLTSLFSWWSTNLLSPLQSLSLLPLFPTTHFSIHLPGNGWLYTSTQEKNLTKQTAILWVDTACSLLRQQMELVDNKRVKSHLAKFILNVTENKQMTII